MVFDEISSYLDKFMWRERWGKHQGLHLTIYVPTLHSSTQYLSLDGSPIKNGHDALQSLEAIDMLPVTPTFLAMSHVTHFSSVALKPALALIYPKYCFFATFCVRTVQLR